MMCRYVVEYIDNREGSLVTNALFMDINIYQNEKGRPQYSAVAPSCIGT